MARQQIATTTRTAFIKALPMRKQGAADGLADNVLDSLYAKHGLITRDDVTINVTTPTYRKLQREGVMA